MPRVRSTCPLLAIAVLAFAGAPASAATAVHCGDTITHDTRLTSDLRNCPGTALTVAADGVTLDLGGHLLDGTNAAGSEGVAVDGHRQVRIVNGSVRDFRFNGVALRNSPRSAVQGVTVRQIGAGGEEGEDVSAGIFVQGSDDVLLDRNTVSNAVTAYQSDGIVVLGSKRPQISGNDSSRNAFNGLVVVQSPGARVSGNRIAGNQNSGIIVFDSPSVTVARNVSSDQVNPDTGGIVLIATTQDAVLGNRLSGNNLGIDLEAGTTASRVAGNDVQGGGDGIGVLDSDRNSVTGNDVHDLPGVGIVLDEFFLEAGSHENAVAGNSVTATGFDGYFVGDASDGNRFEGNFATRSRMNGFRLTSPGNRMSSNTAAFNRRRGIEAVGGTLDGGGNRAFGNGLSPQCSGVACG